MELIIGGAYQGKTNFVKTAFSLSNDDIFVCQEGEELDLHKKCLSHLEKWSAWCVKNGVSPEEEFFKVVKNPEEKILISDDIFCGVVPLDPMERAFREAHGRLLLRISEKSEHVTRVFCGIPARLK